MELYAFHAYAGSFEVAPTTITLSPISSSGVVHITNRGTDTVFAQVEALDWTQNGEQEQFTKSLSLQVSPPMVQLRPGQQQTVRLLAAASPGTNQEHAYRLVISELPDPSARKEGIQVLLQFLVPVFAEASSTAFPKLQWNIKESDNALLLTAHNAGTHHLKLSALTVTGAHGQPLAASGKAFNYLLAGASHQWRVVTAAKVTAGETVAIAAHDETNGMLEGSYVIGK